MPPLPASLLVLSVDVTLTNDKATLDFTIEEIEKLFPVNLGFSCLFICFWSWRGLTGMDQLRRAFYAARRAARAFTNLGIKGTIVFTTSMDSYRTTWVNESWVLVVGYDWSCLF